MLLLAAMAVMVVGYAGAAFAAPVANGGFESGGLQGWTALGQSGDWYVYSGDPPPFGSGSRPPGGIYAAETEQSGPGSQILYQDVTLAAGATHELSFTIFYKNYSSGFYTPASLINTGEPNQQYRVDIMRPGGPVDSVAPQDVLATVFRTNVGDPLTMAPTNMTFDLSPFAGQTVRLRFAEAVNQNYFSAGVDNVNVASTTSDTTPPNISGTPANITNEATSAAGATASWTAPTASDVVDGSVNVDCHSDSGLKSGDTFPLGTTLVTCTAKDAAGNSSTTTFSVTVKDTTAPVIAAHDDVNVTAASGATSAVVNYTNPTAKDTVDGLVKVSCTPASGETFLMGTTPVDCKAVDSHGNLASATPSFTVTVAAAKYTTAPTVFSTSPSATTGTIGTMLNKADNVYATFSEEVKGVNGQTFYLKQYTIDKKGKETYVPIAATVTTPNGITAVLDPTKDLAKGTYQATITNGVADTAGNALVPYSWKFKVN
jgi:hypothetical protein